MGIKFWTWVVTMATLGTLRYQDGKLDGDGTGRVRLERVPSCPPKTKYLSGCRPDCLRSLIPQIGGLPHLPGVPHLHVNRPLDLLFFHVLVAVAVVVSLRSLLLRMTDRGIPIFGLEYLNIFTFPWCYVFILCHIIQHFDSFTIFSNLSFFLMYSISSGRF